MGLPQTRPFFHKLRSANNTLSNFVRIPGFRPVPIGIHLIQGLSFSAVGSLGNL